MLSREEVLKIARLARLDLTESEVTDYQTRLGRVLDHMKELDALELKADFPEHIPSDAMKMRDDSPTSWPNRSKLLENAPMREQNEFLLPPVLDRNEI